jgi:hypothetical protein
LFHETFSAAEATTAKPLSEVHGDSPDTLHNIETAMRKICMPKPKFKEVLEPKEWMKAMDKQFKLKSSKAKYICLRLAKTPVSIFKESHLLRGTELDKISVTVIWAAAYQLLGQITTKTITKTAPLKTPPKTSPRTPPKTTPKQTEPTVKITPTSEAMPEVKFNQEVKEKEKAPKKKAGNQLFFKSGKT